MSRQTRRSTRQTTSVDETSSLPQRPSQLAAQPRHPLARRGTRRSQQSRRSVSVDHFKSSADIGYDDVDDDDDDDDIPANTVAAPAPSQEEVSESDRTYLELTASALVLSCDSIYAFYHDLGTDKPTKKQIMQRGILINSYKAVLGKLAEDGYLDTSAPLWSASDAWAHELPVQPWNIAYRSNTVSLLNNLHDLLQYEDEYEGSFFEQLDNTFPAQFILLSDPSRALELAFRIRCHHFCAKLRGSEKPVLLAAKTFCGEEYTTLTSARQRLASGPYKPFLGIEPADSDGLNDTYQRSMQTLLNEVLNSRSTQVIRDNMEALTPKSVLLKDLHSWALDAYRTISTQEARQGADGEATVHEPLTAGAGDEDPDDSSDSDTEMQPVQEFGVPSTGSFFDGTATIAGPVVDTVAADGGVASGREVDKQVQLQNVVRGLNMADLDDLLDDQPQSSSPTRDPSPVLADSNRPIEAAAQDRQRVASTDVGMAGLPGDDPFEDEDEDDGFEHRTAPLDQSRRIIAVQSTQLVRTAPVQHRAAVAVSATARRSSHDIHIPRLSQGHGPGEISLTLSQLATIEARQRRLAITGKREQGRRIFWTTEEEKHLQDLIAKYECSWSMIEEHGGFDTFRNQQACRDKARNLKVSYLSGNHPLPEKFDKVRLGPKEREAVLRAGGNPNRLEEDIDECGNVINFLNPAMLDE